MSRTFLSAPFPPWTFTPPTFVHGKRIGRLIPALAFAIFVIAQTVWLGCPALAQSGGFHELFDDPSLPEWEMIGHSAVENSSLLMESGGGAVRIGRWSDFELHARMRRIGEGELLVQLRLEDEGSISLRIGGTYAALLLGPQLLVASPLEEIPVREWFTLGTFAAGDELIVEINGRPQLTARLREGPTRGTVGFFFEGPGRGEVDFAELLSLDEESPEAVPEATQALPRETPPSSPSRGEFPSESVVVMFEDMRNGMFDAAVPSGPGTLSVEPAGMDNLAAHLTGEVKLTMHGATWQSYSWRDYDLSLRLKRSQGGFGFGLRWLQLVPHARSDTGRGYWIDHDGREWILSKEVHEVSTELARFPGPVTPDSWHDLTLSVRDVPGGGEISVSLSGVTAFRFTDPSPIPYGTLAFRTQGTAAELWLDDIEVIEHLDPNRTWRQARGPEGVSDVTAIAVDPRDWRVAYAGGSDAGFFKTTDGGRTWQEIGLTRELWTPRIHTIVHAPSDPNILYLGAGGKHISPIWRSDDGGETWKWMRLVSPGGDYLAEADAMAIAVMPDDPMHIYFSIGSAFFIIPPPEFSGVYESRDGGRTYKNLQSGGGNISSVALDPADPRHILAGSLNAAESGVSIIASYDGGHSWAASDDGIAQDDIRQIIFDPSSPGTVFAVAFTFIPEVGGNLYRSEDSGRTWEILASLPKSNGLLYNPPPIPTLYANQPDGLYTSIDAGDSWTRLTGSECIRGISALGSNNPEVIYSITAPTISVSTDRGTTCTQSTEGLLAHPVIGLGISKSNPAVAYIGTTMGVFKTTDAGETWEFLLRGMFAGIAVDPTDSETVYLGAVEGAEVLKSTDGGRGWTNLKAEIHYPGVSTLVIDPNDPQTIYAGTGHGPQMPPQGAGLYKSTDAGKTWNRLPGVPDVAVTAVEIDRGGSGRVAVSTMGNGVLISEDNGLTFEPRNRGFVDDPVARQVWALRMHPQNPDVLYAGTSRHYGQVGSGGKDGLYKTTDGGRNWTMILGGEDVPVAPNGYIHLGGGIDAIAINPARPEQVYAALHDPGIVFSEDGGETWSYVNAGLVPLMTHVYPYRMDISPTGDVLYATSCGRSIFRNLTNVPEDSLSAFLSTLSEREQARPTEGMWESTEPAAAQVETNSREHRR
ncbi:MAG: hypothetical protein JSV66_12315 [Trueperaceae bacterium]|jgi:photosystem II stability/assembly factor-like uncharacterized protein|nr:MAG: hypothetical protein JSV66_12315 [Trueperaceae bacterium]